MDFGGAEEIADLEEAPGASQDADRLRRADQRGFFLHHRAIFFYLRGARWNRCARRAEERG